MRQNKVDQYMQLRVLEEEEEKKKKGKKRIFEEIGAENFPNLKKI